MQRVLNNSSEGSMKIKSFFFIVLFVFIAGSIITLAQPGTPVNIYPIDNDSLVSSTPVFQWSPAGAAADSFRLQVTPDPTFWYVERTYDVTTGNTFTIPTPFSNGSPYYWRVRGYNSLGAGLWSVIDTFRVSVSGDSLPPTAYISFPKDSVVLHNTTVPLNWYTLFNATGITFDIEINNTGTFAGLPSVGYSALSGFTTNFTATAGETYYWKIKSNRGAVETVWSDSAIFAIIPAPPAVTPILSWPIGGAEIYTSTPRLTWYLNTQSTGLVYDYEIGLSSTLTGTATASGSINMYVDLGALTAGQKYYWSARSRGTSDTSAWAGVDSFFVVANGVATVPILSWPKGGASIFTDPVEFSWYMNGYTTGLTYDLECSTTFPLSGTPTVSGITDHDTIIAGLLKGTKYYWSVKTYDGSTSSNWAPTDSFLTVGVAGSSVPIQSWPVGGAIVYGTSANLSWYLNAPYTGLTFSVELSTASDFSALVVNQTGIDTGSLAVIGLTEGIYYFWRVKSYNGVASSAWATDSFFVYNGAAPSMPVNGSPIANLSLNINNPMLSWYLPVSNGNISYDLQYSKSSDFSNAVTVSNLSISFIRLENLEDGQQYYWRVKSKNIQGSSPFSNASSFVVNGITGVADNNVIPEKFAVAQNYPNPFNPSTTIKYSIPANSFVNIKIYDMLGREVKTLIRAQQDAGTYEARWNGDNNSGNKVASGTYIYRVTSGEHTKAMKLMLLK